MIEQVPGPGAMLLCHCGDILRFDLKIAGAEPGTAWVRTDLGSADISRREIIDRVEKTDIKHNEAWHDIPMVGAEPDRFFIELPLFETGHFSAKCYFLPENSLEPVWPEGDNTVINVEPAAFCCAIIIYNAFVRQFGRSRTLPVTPETPLDGPVRELESDGYSVIPPSGKFRDLIPHIEFIMSTLGCRILHLLPIHPTPTTYARMGRFGSPYAALDFFNVDPALAVFDPSATPLEQFLELVHEVHRFHGYVILDIAINHTGWAASIHERHPEWLVRGDDGSIEVPGAWGVSWEDLTRLDYSNTRLWEYMADMFLAWCRRGVDGFRCDAGYMIPLPAWEYLVARVRREYPDTVFFLEGLGGKISTTCDLLDKANMNWAYSELFQNYSREQIRDYFPEITSISGQKGTLVHFAETHDNDRLASRSERYAAMRTALCALFSIRGGFGFANGVEWFAREKINVHQATALNWGSETNQVARISRLSAILTCHPVFRSDAGAVVLDTHGDNTLALSRWHTPSGSRLLVLVNLDCDSAQSVGWSPMAFSADGRVLVDLLEETAFTLREESERLWIDLEPGQVRALTPDRNDLELIRISDCFVKGFPGAILDQRLRAKALEIFCSVNGIADVSGFDLGRSAAFLQQDPVGFVRSLCPENQQAIVVPWAWDRDVKRTVMIPPGFCLFITAPEPFRAEIFLEKDTRRLTRGVEDALPLESGGFFALFRPAVRQERTEFLILKMGLFRPGGSVETESGLMYLGNPDHLVLGSSFTRKQILADPGLKLLGHTSRGGMMRAAAWWGRLESRYDALIAANLSRDYPENRWIMLARCRIWAVYQGYSRELLLNCLESFSFSYENAGKWVFRVPTSEGRQYLLELRLVLHPDENAIRLDIVRPEKDGRRPLLSPDKEVTIIVRPDVEDRSFHDTVKAWTGPEHGWREAIADHPSGFVFKPSPGRRRLVMESSRGTFVREPEWYYMVHRPVEAQRGLDPDSDLFSPGYFSALLRGGECLSLQARVDSGEEPRIDFDYADSLFLSKDAFPAFRSIPDSAVKSMDTFIVERESLKSVIAGFPWFLDWGRDSLIVCRALIEAGKVSEAADILKLFGRFEHKGTLPNMIDGSSAANRETSDAQLWFFAACRELVEAQGDQVLETLLDGRTMREILISIARWLIRGTETGIVMDPDTGLLYSPSHFTWMDTNFPAGTPRQGYPVEIQALWFYALEFLQRVDPAGPSVWQGLGGQVRNSINSLYFLEEKGYFSDCLHSHGPSGAATAEPDDALRPNQLLLITLGASIDAGHARQAVEACMELLVPGGIRSLACRAVTHPLVIENEHGRLNDPLMPYFGHYAGDEDTRRKPAYHNGTAWTWPFPVFCEAWACVFGKQGTDPALAWLGSSRTLMETGCAGYIPEILDGDAPHTARGCDAQAWGCSELARVWLKLLKKKHE